MGIISGISATTESLKLLNELRTIDAQVDKAELKSRLIDLADRLLDAKQALQDARETERTLKHEIESLERRIDQKAHLQDEHGLLFELDENSKRIGEPYCNHCYVKEGELFRLKKERWGGGIRYSCSNCTTLVFSEDFF